jgi:hypothetical protein
VNESTDSNIINKYLGVAKLKSNNKYKSIGIALDKNNISKDDFIKIMESIKFI